MILNFKGLFLTTFESQGPKMIFVQVLSYQGLKMTTFETWGTKTANYANFICFSSDFGIFASNTHKTLICDIFIILMHCWVFLGVFGSLYCTKMMSV